MLAWLWGADDAGPLSHCRPSLTGQVRGLVIGSSNPSYGSLVRFGDTVVTTVLSSSEAGYTTAFTSEDHSLTLNQTAQAG